MVEWSELLGELLVLIAKKLPSVLDVVRFGAVCRSWGNAISHDRQSLLTPKFPWMMLANEEEVGFILAPTKEFLIFHLPEVEGRTCFGSPHGWLVTLDHDCQVHLLNPISHFRHQLPPIESPHINDIFPLYSARKSITSLTSPSSTLPEDCVVMIIFGYDEQLAFARLSDKSWNLLDSPRGPYDDILYFNNHFHAVNFRGEVEVCDLIGPRPTIKEFAPPPPMNPNNFTRLYLVEMSGEFHMVVRTSINQEGDYSTEEDTITFEVYKWDFTSGKWIELASFNEHTLFIGRSSSFSVLASDHPDCKGNCIYFTDDFQPFSKSCCGYDMGVYDFKLKKIDLLYGADKDFTVSCPAVWFMPKI